MNQINALRETVALAEQLDMPELPGHSLGLAHLREMLQVVETSDFSESKMGRWLGWAQAAVVAYVPRVTLEDMKMINLRNSDEGWVEY